MTLALVDDDDNVVAGEWIYLEARPITVRIEADNDFPVTGDTEDERTVELTATVDGPSGVTLQWQQWSGTAWTNLGTPTPSNPATLDVDASSEEVDGETEYLRGTKKYQVAVSHSTESPADLQHVGCHCGRHNCPHPYNPTSHRNVRSIIPLGPPIGPPLSAGFGPLCFLRRLMFPRRCGRNRNGGGRATASCGDERAV